MNLRLILTRMLFLTWSNNKITKTVTTMEKELDLILNEFDEGNMCLDTLKGKLLLLFSVSQQRVLLKAYDNTMAKKHFFFMPTSDESKDEFLKAFNCG